MNEEKYVEILKENLRVVASSSTKNHLKHSSVLVKNKGQHQTQSPDLNPIENKWGDLKKNVHASRPSNQEERFAKIPLK